MVGKRRLAWAKMFKQNIQGWFCRLHNPELKPLELLLSLLLRFTWNILGLVQVRSDLQKELSCVTPRGTLPCCTCLCKWNICTVKKHWKQYRRVQWLGMILEHMICMCSELPCCSPPVQLWPSPRGCSLYMTGLWFDGITSPSAQKCGDQHPSFHHCTSTTSHSWKLASTAGSAWMDPSAGSALCLCLTHEGPAVSLFHCLTLLEPNSLILPCTRQHWLGRVRRLIRSLELRNRDVS